MQDVWALIDVMYRCMMFGEVIGQIDAAFSPINEKLPLTYTVSDPIKTHVNGFGLTLFDGIIDDSQCGAIICL